MCKLCTRPSWANDGRSRDTHRHSAPSQPPAAAEGWQRSLPASTRSQPSGATKNQKAATVLLWSTRRTVLLWSTRRQRRSPRGNPHPGDRPRPSRSVLHLVAWLPRPRGPHDRHARWRLGNALRLEHLDPRLQSYRAPPKYLASTTRTRLTARIANIHRACTRGPVTITPSSPSTWVPTHAHKDDNKA